MGDKKRFTSSRKLDHLRICAEKEVESGDTGFGDIRFVHNALPECDMGTIDLTSRFLNRNVLIPPVHLGNDRWSPRDKRSEFPSCTGS